MGEHKKLGKELAYKGKIVDVYVDRIELPNGKKVDWDLVELSNKGASAVLPIDEDGKVILIKQFRNGLGKYVLEIPAGGRDSKDEDPLVCATRELEEEIGYSSNNIEHLLDIATAIGFSSEVVSIYSATNLIKSKQHLDEDEFIEIYRYTFDELTQMIINKEIIDAKTVVAILTYKAKHNF